MQTPRFPFYGSGRGITGGFPKHFETGPPTSVLGAILLTGYLGGATLTHLRVVEQFIMPVIVGVVVWGGFFLREPRLRKLIPLRR